MKGCADEKTGRDRLDQIHEVVRERIMMLDYPPGEKLSETALADEFGVSRTPLRRVLARLEDEGLLLSVHGVGTIVTDVDLDELAEVYRLRTELIILIASLDPVPVSDEVVVGFTALHARALAMRETPSPRDFAVLDRDMFLAINSLSANRPLRETGSGSISAPPASGYRRSPPAPPILRTKPISIAVKPLKSCQRSRPGRSTPSVICAAPISR